MPPKKYADMWWEEMPEKAHQAAIAMGYSSQSWDDDAKISYDQKKFHETTLCERRAAMYLGLDPIVKKLDIWWKDTDAETLKHAAVMGWDQHKWDDNWHIRDFPIDKLYWSELNEEQKTSAVYFGYTRCTWDEDGNDSDLDFNEPINPGSSSSGKPGDKNEEKKEDEDDSNHHHQVDTAVEEEMQGTSTSNNSGGKKPQKASTSNKPQATAPATLKSKKFGGDGGTTFNHGNHQVLMKLIIKHDEHAIHQLCAVYNGGKLMTSGTDDGNNKVEFNFTPNEYVTKITIRHNKLIQCLTFTTNKGKTIGPAGGKGWGLLGKDKKGEEEDIIAPDGYRLCGFSGAAGNYLDSIVFHWAPIN